MSGSKRQYVTSWNENGSESIKEKGVEDIYSSVRIKAYVWKYFGFERKVERRNMCHMLTAVRRLIFWYHIRLDRSSNSVC